MTTDVVTPVKVIAPTVEQLNADHITQLADKYWAPHTMENHSPFNADVIEDIYHQDIRGSNFSIRRIMILEFSQYLENYLWPNYKPDATHAHVMSIVIMLNEKFRERVQVWQAFKKNNEYFPQFFQQVLCFCLEDDELLINIREQTALLVFLNHCFNSMEEAICRDRVKRLVSLSMWVSLQPERREHEFKLCPKWKKYWKAILRKDKQDQLEKLTWERTFLHKLMLKFIRILDTISATEIIPEDKVHYCERFLELITDLEALLPTRRFFNTVLDDCHLVVRCQLSNLVNRPKDISFVSFSIRRIMILEFSQYLENYLWPNYKPDATHAHVMSIVIMLNEKFRERVQVWQAFKKNNEYFPQFFQQVLCFCLEDDELLINIREQTALLVFLNHCFNSMEEAICRDRVKRLVSLSMWVSLQPERREHEFKLCPKWKKYWKAILRKDKQDQLEKLTWERTFLHKLMLKFIRILDTISATEIIPEDKVHYCERFLELITDLKHYCQLEDSSIPYWMTVTL
ncbi:dna2/nam7 helicase family [Holotrichia oblita]|uniref:Dna2/nam7 helicase family n=1 Tax=Holotrichia oblita TaxID=644536 RepID=A0ACB9TNG8_HOLOL|nr:dna2/nam7 helicase family [Holotrichia oblita]